MYILGINSIFHDSSACLIQDGRIVAAVEEERFSRHKKHKDTRPFHGALLPFHSIAYCLQVAGITLSDIDHIGYSFDPKSMITAFDEKHNFTISPYLEPNSKTSDIDLWNTVFLAGAVHAPRLLIDDVPWRLKPYIFSANQKNSYEFHFIPHHLCHAASAFYPSPFSEAAVLTIDGHGGDITTALYYGKANRLELLKTVELPHSLGLLYENLTAYLGFKPSSDEFKVMALASFGEPKYLENFSRNIHLENGGYTIDTIDLVKEFGPARSRADKIEQRHYDIAASLQKALEQTVFSICDWLQKETNSDNLALAGGVAMNCVLNGKLKKESQFDRVWIQPAAGDSGTALGAALELSRKYDPKFNSDIIMKHAFLGPEFEDAEIEDILKEYNIHYSVPSNLFETVAELLADEKTIGWFQGRMEFGSRALGARSILASPIPANMKERLNQIKGRESFRPVAPLVLEEKVSDWFDFSGPAPFMNFVADVHDEKRKLIPSAVHVDGSARIQTVGAIENEKLHLLMSCFENITGIPILINTSFNTRGEPIVCSPRDAIASFFTTAIDVLVIGNCMVSKR